MIPRKLTPAEIKALRARRLRSKTQAVTFKREDLAAALQKSKEEARLKLRQKREKAAEESREADEKLRQAFEKNPLETLLNWKVAARDADILYTRLQDAADALGERVPPWEWEGTALEEKMEPYRQELKERIVQARLEEAGVRGEEQSWWRQEMLTRGLPETGVHLQWLFATSRRRIMFKVPIILMKAAPGSVLAENLIPAGPYTSEEIEIAEVLFQDGQYETLRDALEAAQNLTV